MAAVDSSHAVVAITFSMDASFFKFVGKPFSVETNQNVVPDSVAQYVTESIALWMNANQVMCPLQVLVYRCAIDVEVLIGSCALGVTAVPC